MTVGHSRANLVQPLGRPTAAQNRDVLSARSARTVQTGPTAKRVRQLPGPTAIAVGPGSWRQTSLNGLNLAHSKPYGCSQFFHHLFRLGTSYKMSIGFAMPPCTPEELVGYVLGLLAVASHATYTWSLSLADILYGPRLCVKNLSVTPAGAFFWMIHT